MQKEEFVKSFKVYLSKNGLRYTKEREILIDELISNCKNKHFNAPMIYEKMKDKVVKVSRATIFRNLSLLVKAGLLTKVDLGENFDSFEIKKIDDHHDHLICLQCGKVIEFYSKDIEKIQDKVIKKHSFKPLYHKHEIYGYCEECQKINS